MYLLIPLTSLVLLIPNLPLRDSRQSAGLQAVPATNVRLYYLNYLMTSQSP